MTKTNETYNHEQKLANAYDQKLRNREREILKHLTAITGHLRYYNRGYFAVFSDPLLTGLASGKYKKPSEFFETENSWVFDCIIYERFRKAFLYMVDHVRENPYSISWQRRSFRSEQYASYTDKIGSIVATFWREAVIDADICDILTGNLPEEILCYLRTKDQRPCGFAPEVLAYELDQENPQLEQVLTDIILGEGSFSTVSPNLIRGIVLSHNERMHQLLCDLLLAARLQEGLRQAICENADWGTKEAFQRIFSTILEHNLIRYSSVKRAVGTWLGFGYEEQKALDRISSKSLSLLRSCLSDHALRETCLQGEDSMEIYIALWSYAFDSVEHATKILDTVSREGTHHQMLTAGYFLENLENSILKQSASRMVLHRHRDSYDLLAVYLPHFISCPNGIASNLIHKNTDKTLTDYFDSPEEARDFCDWLCSVHASMKKKDLVFEPCIFPWHKAVLKKSDLIEKAIIIAALLEDQDRIDRFCPLIGECDAFDRNLYFEVLTMGQKTPAVREAILRGLSDKAFDTRQAAYERCRELELTADEYRIIEDLLRLRYEDLRRNAMELLLNQSEGPLKETIHRLLTASKTEKRTAALDMLTQLKKQAERSHLLEHCLPFVKEIQKPTTQEQVLIDALIPQKEDSEQTLPYTDSDCYQPVFEIDEYLRTCLQEYKTYFPDSILEEQVVAGNLVHHPAISKDILPCASAERAKRNLESLSDYIVQHETDSFEHSSGRTMLIGTNIDYFFLSDDGACHWTVPRMDLWENWYEEQHVSLADIIAMYALNAAQPRTNPYLLRCSHYIVDLFGAGFQEKTHYRYEDYMERILHELIRKKISKEMRRHLAIAMGLWVARCLPEDMLLGFEKEGFPKTDTKLNSTDKIPMNFGNGSFIVNQNVWTQMFARVPGHFLVHPQIKRFLFPLELNHDTTLRYAFPIAVQVYERTFASTQKYLESAGMPCQKQIPMFLNDIYAPTKLLFYKHQAPDAATYFYAYHLGLFSEQTLYYHLMRPEHLQSALELVTSVSVMRPTAENQVSSRCFAGYRGTRLRITYENFIGSEKDLSEEQLQLIELCQKVADKLIAIVLGVELHRGDTPTEYSPYVRGIQSLSGAEIFVRILSALGKDSLDRSVYYWGSSNSKRGNLSYLLSRCAPAVEDSVETLRALLQNTDISEKRLIEAALFSPEWIDLIGEYLQLPGFKSVCYYFMAHMNEQFDEQKKAVIARFSPLSEDELNLGAFDVQWFQTSYAQVGEKMFDLIYDAAKYISDGNKHTRARKYADAALGKLNVVETEAAIREKRNKDLLMAYAIIPLRDEKDLIHRYLYLQQFLKESRQFGSQRATNEKKAAETALRNLATNAGFSDSLRLTLRMETRLAEGQQELFEEKAIGEWVFRLMIDDRGVAEIECTKDGKLLKSIPAKVKKDSYVVRLLEMKKMLTEQYRRTRRMFEQAMEDGAIFRLEELRQLTQNRVVAPILSKLVFYCEEGLGFFDGTRLVDLEGHVFAEAPDSQVTVAHPFHLYQSGRWTAFQQYIFEGKILQPFKQVFRELYVKTDDERGVLRSLRYAGHQIQPKKAAACLKERRWVADVESGLQKVYYQENIAATIFALADWFSPADIEAPTLEYVAFFHRKTGEALKIDDIPDVIFSEVMRDVDLAVSVAHVGGVDPETSHSTIEMRAALLAFTLPLLRLDNVRIQNSHAIIEGSLARYSVHLGSGVVHQIGGSMLNVLPVHSRHRGRIFLPFMDDDPKTAEILSKVILFSEDRKLKDPSILSQISH